MISKSFDDMTGTGQANTGSFQIFKQGGWLSAKQEINIFCAITVGEGFRQCWLIVNSRLQDWAFSGNTQVFALVDDKRHSFDGFVESFNTEWVGDTLVCLESFHVPTNEEFFSDLAAASTARIRLAGTDFDLPQELIDDMKELIKAI